MKYIRLFEEFIQDPVNVNFEIKQMMDAFKKFIESEGFEIEMEMNLIVKIVF